MLYSYGKNIFYYKYISENVRLGRQKFYLPTRSTSKNTYSNYEILRLLDESALAILLQDINPKDIKIYNKNKKLLELFKDKFGNEISKLVQLDDTAFIKETYKDVTHLFKNKNLTTILQQHFNQQDIYHIKENLYNIDYWITKAYFQENKKFKEIQELFDEKTILQISTQHRETLLGFLLYLTKINEKYAHAKDFLITIYNKNIIHIPDQGITIRNTIINNLYNEYQDILQAIITIDDNPDFLRMGEENREWFIKKTPLLEAKKQITGEDYLWFKGYLKNVTYYNKRFFIPK